MTTPLSKRERFWIALCIVLAVGFFIGGGRLPAVDARESQSSLYDELKTFTDVLSIVQRDYVSEVESNKLVGGAIKGMLSTLDPHSGYLDPHFYKDLQVQTRGEFGGLGIEITFKDGLLVVVAPMDSSPAEKAGVKAGDAIVKIDGKFTKDFTLVDAVKRLRGPKGTPIEISIHREGHKELIPITIIRDIIKVKSVRGRLLDDGFGYARVTQFMERTADDLKTALRKMADRTEDKTLNGLVVDVRNNPGGLLTQAIRVSDLFLREGIIVYTDGRVAAQKQKFFAHTRGTEPDYPIIVLVNGGSASASEILAGALQDHGRALVLGSQSFGKGSVQTITPLENGGALTLTTALYYTKSGRSIQATGITPDILMSASGKEVQVSEASKDEQVRESSLPGAIKNPDGIDSRSPMQKINKTPTEGEDLQRIDLETVDIDVWLEKDPQLKRALELLKTFNIFGKGGKLTDSAVKEEAKPEKAA